MHGQFGLLLGFTGSKVLVSKPFSLAGKSGWRVTGEVYVSNIGPDIKGDTLDIIVLSTGSSESLAMYMSAITIDDARRLPWPRQPSTPWRSTDERHPAGTPI